jgi:tRNA (adenine37-N6)-methyltransferase
MSQEAVLQTLSIGKVVSPFVDRYGIPRQSGLTPSVPGQILIDLPWADACSGLETFSHIWIIFQFHEHGAKMIRPTIRPPRLGGITRMGVFASRSPHRPSGIGMSVVQLKSWRKATAPERAKGIGAVLQILGLDLLNGTPVLDIKPYIPYADALPEASSGWLVQEDHPNGPGVERLVVTWSDEAQAQALEVLSPDFYSEFSQHVAEVLSLDPRTAAQKRKLPAHSNEGVGRIYGMNFGGMAWNKFQFPVFDVRWTMESKSHAVIVECLISKRATAD